MTKYRIHEVAKDFGMQSKTIMNIMTEYFALPKNHMQVLTDEELNFIFDYITQHNQVDNIARVFEAAPKPETSAPEPVSVAQPDPKPAEDGAKQPQQPEQQAEQKPEQPPQPQQNTAQPQQRQQTFQKPAQQPQQPHQPQQKPAQSPPQQTAQQTVQQSQSKVPQKKTIDTRGPAVASAEKYDERLEHFVPDKLANVKQGKEKWTKKNQGGKGAAAASAKRRQEQRTQMQRLQLEIAKKQPLKVVIPDQIAVGELASRMKKTGAEIVRQLIKTGVMASVSDVIDYETAALIAMDMGCKVEHEVVMTIEERLIDASQDKSEDLVPRSPVVVVMGHVDHGKTSLLDRVRNANVVAGEAGGITQHIGAYQVEIKGKLITFLDTPGHEAFTSMRARGAMVTDIAILVVAADDGIMPQTVEAINHAKAAQIPIIVAINKMDKPGANPERIKQQLTEYGLLSEEWGGDTIICEISAKTGAGIENLLEMVTLTAEMRELKANPNRLAKGTVIEARLDKGRGPIATILVQNGTLKPGDVMIAGNAVGRVRTMAGDKGQRLEEAGPSVPVEITGLSEAPAAGDIFNAVEDERMARELALQRKDEQKTASSASGRSKVSLEDLFAQIQQGEIKELAVIIKADVQGSAEAIKSSLEKLSNNEVHVHAIHSGVGAISESDVMLAGTSNAIIIGFNVRPDAAARDSAMRANVDIRTYRIIYECIDEIEAAIKGMLSPKFKEALTGHCEVRQIFKASKIGTIAGCYVVDGKINRNSKIRLVRDGIVVHEGEISSLKRVKDDVREVAAGYECGITLDRYNDIKEGDIIEAFIMEKTEA